MAKFQWVSTNKLLQSKIQRISSDGKLVETTWGHKQDVPLPQRQTELSAGYDFYFPFEDFTLEPGETVLIQTGVKITGLNPEEDLELHIRSGRGIFNFLRIANVVGIVDADYELAENEGNIGAAIRNEGSLPYTFKHADRFIQGIIRVHAFTEDDEPVKRKRTGGGSSTDAK